jgi:ribosomal-protein-alanine N-acetyltransferase
VAATNEPAIGLYMTLGFEPISRRRGYYADGTDALVMERALGDAA